MSADTTASAPALPDFHRRLERFEWVLCEYMQGNASRDAVDEARAALASQPADMRTAYNQHVAEHWAGNEWHGRDWIVWQGAWKAALASQPVAPAVPLTDEQFADEWHRRTGRIMGTDKALLLQAKYVTELAHGIAAAPDTTGPQR